MRKLFTAAGGILLSAAFLFFFYFYSNFENSKGINNFQKVKKQAKNNPNELAFLFSKGSLILKGQIKEKIFPYIDNPTVKIISKKLLIEGVARKAVIIYTGRVNIIRLSGKVCRNYPASIERIYFFKGRLSIKGAKIYLNRRNYLKIKELPAKKVENICYIIEKVKSSYVKIDRSKSLKE